MAVDTQVKPESNGHKTRQSIMVSVPVEFHGLLAQKAEAEGKTLAGFVRDMLASEFNYTLPPVTRQRARKYASEEERKAAQAENQRQRNALAKRLIEAYRKGEIKLDA